MAITARDTEPRTYYRRTRSAVAGVYYMRPARSRRNTPEALVARLLARGAPLGGYWASVLSQHPDAVLLRQYSRGTCSTTGDRWEIKRWVLLPPDLRLRAVKSRPGYTEHERRRTAPPRRQEEPTAAPAGPSAPAEPQAPPPPPTAPAVELDELLAALSAWRTA